jgi:hypothetical protein
MCSSKPAMSCVPRPGLPAEALLRPAQIAPEVYESSSLGEVPPESQGVMCACKDDISCLTYRSAGAGESLRPVSLVCDGHGFPEKAARDSSSYSAAKVDGPSPLRSKSPGHSYLTEAEASAQPSGRSLLVVRRGTRTDASRTGSASFRPPLARPAQTGKAVASPLSVDPGRTRRPDQLRHPGPTQSLRGQRQGSGRSLLVDLASRRTYDGDS